MKKILIGSVYTDHVRSPDWYKLQMKFIEKNTDDFDHCVFVNGTGNYFEKSQVIGYGYIANDISQQSYNHLFGLKMLLDYFRRNSEQYDNFAILDSDCFPIKQDWVELLLRNGYDASINIRYENLDVFPHPSIVFFNKFLLDKIDFDVLDTTNLIGETYRELQVLINGNNNKQWFFPILRTNRINYHPIMYGIYYDMFYHHGAGSRELKFRSINGVNGNKFSYYYQDTLKIHEKNMFNYLVNNPEDFIKELFLDKKCIKYL